MLMSFVFCVSCVLAKKSVLNQDHKDFLCLLLEVFIVSGFTFKPMIHFAFIVKCSMIYGSFHVLNVDVHLFQHSLSPMGDSSDLHL